VIVYEVYEVCNILISYLLMNVHAYIRKISTKAITRSRRTLNKKTSNKQIRPILKNNPFKRPEGRKISSI
jgi:hypothetical protein